MTKLEALGPFVLVPTQGRKACSVGKSSLAKMACILFVFCVAATTASTAQTYTDLYDMGASSADPNDPVWSGVIAQGHDGNMYSTTPQFWTGGGGDVFKITPEGTVTVLYSFDLTGRTGNGGLTLATDGNFYGATPSEVSFPYGRIFRITPGGSLTTLYSFTNGPDGANPTAPPHRGPRWQFLRDYWCGRRRADSRTIRLRVQDHPIRRVQDASHLCQYRRSESPGSSDASG